MSYKPTRYISIQPDTVLAWDLNEAPTLEPIYETVDPYVRNIHGMERRGMEHYDNLPKYERARIQDDYLYGQGLYEDEMQLRELGYTGRVSPLVRRKGVNNRYR